MRPSNLRDIRWELPKNLVYLVTYVEGALSRFGQGEEKGLFRSLLCFSTGKIFGIKCYI
jgi:hypothetical protein